MGDFIEVYDNALSHEVCDQILAKFDSQQHLQSPGATGSGIDASRKDSLDITITDYEDWKPLSTAVMSATMDCFAQYVRKYFLLVSGSISATLRDRETGAPFVVSPEDAERLPAPQLLMLLQRFYRPGPLIVQRYEQGQGGYHHWHWETYPSDPNCEILHRVLLFMFYLNDVAEGGETSFFYQNQQISPAKGRMVIAPAYFTHTHRGEVPVSNHKYIVTSWILFSRAEHIYR